MYVSVSQTQNPYFRKISGNKFRILYRLGTFNSFNGSDTWTATKKDYNKIQTVETILMK
jgi:hypothetical protein